MIVRFLQCLIPILIALFLNFGLDFETDWIFEMGWFERKSNLSQIDPLPHVPTPKRSPLFIPVGVSPPCASNRRQIHAFRIGATETALK